MALDETSAGLLVTFLILLAGFLAAKLGGSLIIAISKRKETINIRRIQLVKIYRYLVMILAIIIALLYLRKGVVGDVSIVGNFLQKTYKFLPNILLFALLIVLGIVVANLIAFILKRFFDTTGLTELMIEQNREHVLNGILVAIRIVLYVLILVVLLSLFGMSIRGLTTALGWIFYATLALLFLYLFIGTRAFVENFIAGLYKNHQKPSN